MYQKGEGELAISFTGHPPRPIHCSNPFQKYSIEEYSYLRETDVLLQQDKLHQNYFILWRSGCYYMKEKLIHTVEKWTTYFQWLPKSTRKD